MDSQLDKLAKFGEVCSDDNKRKTTKVGHASKKVTEKELLEIARRIDPSNAKELASLDLDLPRKKAVVYGYMHKISIANEALSGVEPQDLINLVNVLSKDDLDLNSIFTDDGSFIDYEKVKKLL